MDINNIAGHFLIALPGLDDPNFNHTVILVCEHTREGAFGLIINKILMNSVLPLLSAYNINNSFVDLPVYYGGPVNPGQGYIIYTPFNEKYESIKVSENLAVTASKEILYDIAEGNCPGRFVFALGFAGWASNQLEQELMMDSWLVSPLDVNIIFNVPAKERWKSAAALVGVDFDRYCKISGNA